MLIYIGLGGLRAAALNNLILRVPYFGGREAHLRLRHVGSGGWDASLAALERMKIGGKAPGTVWTRLVGFGLPPAMQARMVPALIMNITLSISIAQLALLNPLMQFYAAKDVRMINYCKIIGPLAVTVHAAPMFSLGGYCYLILNHELASSQVLALLKDVDKVIPLVVMKLAPPGVRADIGGGRSCLDVDAGRDLHSALGSPRQGPHTVRQAYGGGGEACRHS